MTFGKITWNDCVTGSYRRLSVRLRESLGRVSAGPVCDGGPGPRRVPAQALQHLWLPGTNADDRVPGGGQRHRCAERRANTLMVPRPSRPRVHAGKATTPIVVAGGIGYAGVRMLLKQLDAGPPSSSGPRGRMSFVWRKTLEQRGSSPRPWTGPSGSPAMWWPSRAPPR